MTVGLDLDRHKRPQIVSSEAERAKQLLEQRLAAILEDAEGEYRYFLEQETPRHEKYPRNPLLLTQRLIAIELGPRAQLWSEQSAGAPYCWEDENPWHPDGRVSLEGTVAGDGYCQAWPTRRVHQAIREGWLLYCKLEDTHSQAKTADQGGTTLAARLERQFIYDTRMAVFRDWQVREAQRRGSWLHVPTGSSLGGPPVWNDAMEAELQRRLHTHRPGTIF